MIAKRTAESKKKKAGSCRVQHHKASHDFKKAETKNVVKQIFCIVSPHTSVALRDEKRALPLPPFMFQFSSKCAQVVLVFFSPYRGHLK
jgi:hypothetical protein